MSAGTNSSPSLSVILAFRNAAQYLPLQLESLALQFCEFTWELLLVDNGSNDRSVAIAQSFKERLPMQIISAPDRANQAYAQNIGAMQARAHLLLFIDADDETAPGFMNEIYRCLQIHRFVTCQREVEKLNERWLIDAHSLPERIYRSRPPFAFGSALGVSKEIFDSVGGFAEKPSRCPDLWFSLLLREKGIIPYVIETQLLHYRFRSSLLSMFRQTYHWGYGISRCRKKFGPRVLPSAQLFEIVKDWKYLLKLLRRGHSRAERGSFFLATGYLLGRFTGSIRFRIFYL